MPFLETIGSTTQVPRLRKRVRDTVNIDNAERPWRRHPFWLVLRVAIQRQLSLALGDCDGRAVYKFLLVYTLTTLLKQCPNRMAAEMTLLLKRKVCRRFAKLEDEATQLGESSLCRHLLRLISPRAKSVLSSVSYEINSAWSKFKQQKTREVFQLSPVHCQTSERDFVLPLKCSGELLDYMLQHYSPQLSRGSSSQELNITDEGIKMVQMFAKKYHDIADSEKSLKRYVPHNSNNSNHFSSYRDADNFCTVS